MALTADKTPQAFLFGSTIEPHDVSDADCGACWKPPHLCWCGGLEHFEFGAENSDGSYWLHSRCDECGTGGRR